MDITEILKCVTELTGVGLAGLVVIVGYFLGRLVINLGRNHLEHMEKAYDKLTESVDLAARAQEISSKAQEMQTDLIRLQSIALTVNTSALQALRDLIERKT
jgi:hypothetical protein